MSHGYRDRDEALRDRWAALEGRWESADRTHRSLCALLDRAAPTRETPTLPPEASAAAILTATEALEADVRALERDVQRLSDEVARRPKDAPEKPRKTPRTPTPTAPREDPYGVGEALARHSALRTRLRRIAPLVELARSARQEGRVDPASLLERRPSTANVSGDAAAALARRVSFQCDAAERELERLGLGHVTGLGADRVEEAARVRAMVAEIRYERLAERAPTGNAVRRGLGIADLTGNEALEDLEQRCVWLDEKRTAEIRDADAVDDALAALAGALERYQKSAAAVPPRARSRIGMWPTLPRADDVAAIGRATGDLAKSATDLAPLARLVDDSAPRAPVATASTSGSGRAQLFVLLLVPVGVLVAGAHLLRAGGAGAALVLVGLLVGLFLFAVAWFVSPAQARSAPPPGARVAGDGDGAAGAEADAPDAAEATQEDARGPHARREGR